MISNKLSPDNLINMEVNMFWDGIFHAMVWVLMLAGIGLLWKRQNKYFGISQNKIFYGSLILGVGIFNLIEGILDHTLFQIHHVIQNASPSDQLFWDVTFLVFGGVMFIMAGIFLLKAKSH